MNILEKRMLFSDLVCNLRVPKTYEGQVHMWESAAVRSEKITNWWNNKARVQSDKNLRVSLKKCPIRTIQTKKVVTNWLKTGRASHFMINIINADDNCLSFVSSFFLLCLLICAWLSLHTPSVADLSLLQAHICSQDLSAWLLRSYAMGKCSWGLEHPLKS